MGMLTAIRETEPCNEDAKRLRILGTLLGRPGSVDVLDRFSGGSDDYIHIYIEEQYLMYLLRILMQFAAMEAPMFQGHDDDFVSSPCGFPIWRVFHWLASSPGDGLGTRLGVR